MQVEPIVVGAFQVNCFIVSNDRRQALVIDPGADASLILDHLEQSQLDVAAYLLTHGHIDHISALNDMCAARPAPIGIHEKDLAWAFGGRNSMLPFYPATIAPSTSPQDLSEAATPMEIGFNYSVIDTPGHTPGGVCIYFESEASLFCGDTLFAGSVGRTDLPGGDSRVLAESIKRLTALPNDTVVYSGHGPSTTIGHEKQTNFFMRGH